MQLVFISTFRFADAQRFGGFANFHEGSLLPFLGFCKFIVQVALLKYTKTFIKTILYSMKKHHYKRSKF